MEGEGSGKDSGAMQPKARRVDEEALDAVPEPEEACETAPSGPPL